MPANVFFLLRLPNCFSMCLDSDTKILPLCYKHVIPMSLRQFKDKSLACVFRSLFEAGTGKLILSFL